VGAAPLGGRLPSRRAVARRKRGDRTYTGAPVLSFFGFAT
jgi:hypothetical protein